MLDHFLQCLMWPSNTQHTSFCSPHLYSTIDYVYITFRVTFHVVWKTSQYWANICIQLNIWRKQTMYQPSLVLYSSTVHALITNNTYTLCLQDLLQFSKLNTHFDRVQGKHWNCATGKHQFCRKLCWIMCNLATRNHSCWTKGMKSLLWSIINFIRKCFVSITYTFSRVLMCC